MSEGSDSEGQEKAVERESKAAQLESSSSDSSEEEIPKGEQLDVGESEAIEQLAVIAEEEELDQLEEGRFHTGKKKYPDLDSYGNEWEVKQQGQRVDMKHRSGCKFNLPYKNLKRAAQQLSDRGICEAKQDKHCTCQEPCCFLNVPESVAQCSAFR
jgi:hypothetical protein